MMRMVGEAAIAIGGSVALSLIVKATAVLGAALLASRVARRNRASVRHMLLATAFVILLALPVTSVVVPARPVSVPIASMGDSPPTTTVSLVDTSVAIAQRVDPLKWPGLGGESTTTASTIGLLWVAWFAGLILFLVPTLIGLARVGGLQRDGFPWREGQQALTEIAATVGVRKRIRLLLHEAVDGPITCGFLQPAIVLPRDAPQWAHEDLHRAILHELEHIRRSDWLMLCIARAVCAVYWFHPLVWMSWRQLRLEAERACDDAVLLAAQPEAYADQLVTLAERLLTGKTESALAMVNRGDLFARVSAVLDNRQPRGRAGLRWIAAASAAAMFLLSVVAPLRAVAVHHSALKASDGSRLIFETPSIQDRSSGNSNDAWQRTVTVEDQRAVVAARPAPVRSINRFGHLNVQLLPATDLPAFEVASIKPSAGDLSGRPNSSTILTNLPGRLLITNMTARGIIRNAYGFFIPNRDDVTGGPSWIDEDRWDVEATLEGTDQSQNRKMLMLQRLLADRFKLEVHRQTRRVETYNLVFDGRDGKPGAGLRSTAGCTRTLPGTPPPSAGTKPCGARGGPGRFQGTGVTMSALANFLSNSAGRPVADQTGLTGEWDVDLTWSQEVSLFTALKEQLGLKLESGGTTTQDGIVIDRIERPQAN